MLNFFDYNIFPDDVLPALSRYLINPSASTTNNELLSLILRKYDSEIFLTISEINDGDNFIYSDKKYMKCQKIRKRIKCLNLDNDRYYLFNPITQIKKIDLKIQFKFAKNSGLNKNNYAVIMAGGIGSRFWPLSKKEMPKQFLDILGVGELLFSKHIEDLV